MEKIRELCIRALGANGEEFEKVVGELQATIRFWKDLEQEKANRSLRRVA